LELFTLDLGCGDAPRNPFNANHVFGVDLLDLPEKNVRGADLAIEAIPFGDSTFDFVTAYDFIEHVPRVLYLPKRRNPFVELMNEIYRVLKVGGKFLSFTPAYPHPEAFYDPTHVNVISEKTFPLYFDNQLMLARRYGFSGQFKVDGQQWQGAHLWTLMTKESRVE